jgi:hypothetical protein
LDNHRKRKGEPSQGTDPGLDLVSEHFGHDLPPLEAVENEAGGCDYVLRYFRRHSEEELGRAGLTWAPGEPF